MIRTGRPLEKSADSIRHAALLQHGSVLIFRADNKCSLVTEIKWALIFWMESHLLFGHSSLLPGLGSQSCKREGRSALCRDSFKCYGGYSLIHLFHFLPPSHSLPPFHSLFFFFFRLGGSLFSLSSFSVSLSLSHSLHLLLNSCPSVVSVFSRSWMSSSLLVFFPHPRCQSETKNRLALLHLTLFSLPHHTFRRDFQVINSTLKIGSPLYCNACEMMKLYLTKLFYICVMKHANKARSKTRFLSKAISTQRPRSTKGQVRLWKRLGEERKHKCPLESVI